MQLVSSEEELFLRRVLASTASNDKEEQQSCMKECIKKSHSYCVSKLDFISSPQCCSVSSSANTAASDTTRN